jgi:hypothetical protein
MFYEFIEHAFEGDAVERVPRLVVGKCHNCSSVGHRVIGCAGQGRRETTSDGTGDWILSPHFYSTGSFLHR